MSNSLLALVILPALVIYWAILKSNRDRTLFLAIASISILAVAAPVAAIGLFVLTVVVFLSGKRLLKNPALIYLLLAIAIPLSILIAFKYLAPVLANLELIPALAIPLGVSYYTFKNIHYLIECSRGKFQDARFTEYLAYIYFVPMFVAGPIERFDNFLPQTRAQKFSFNLLSEGGERIIIGAIKKFIVADLLLKALLPPLSAVENGAPTLEWDQILFASFIKFLYTYFDFAGYTDMVLGVALLFGIRLMENFNFPLLRSNLAEFWRAWHMSLSSWARDYIYFPLIGRYRSPALALIATMLMIGVWHGPYPGWALWGLHHGLGLTLLAYYHRWVRDKTNIQQLRATLFWRVTSTLTVWWYVSIGYALTFVASDVHTSISLYLKILTFGALS